MAVACSERWGSLVRLALIVSFVGAIVESTAGSEELNRSGVWGYAGVGVEVMVWVARAYQPASRGEKCSCSVR